MYLIMSFLCSVNLFLIFSRRMFMSRSSSHVSFGWNEDPSLQRMRIKSFIVASGRILLSVFAVGGG